MPNRNSLGEAVDTTRSAVGLVKDIALYGFIAFIIWKLLVSPDIFTNKIKGIADALRGAGVNKVSLLGQSFDLSALKEEVQASELDQQRAQERLGEALESLAKAKGTLDLASTEDTDSNPAELTEARQAASRAIERAQEAINTSIRQADHAQNQLLDAVNRTVATASKEPSVPATPATEPGPLPELTVPMPSENGGDKAPGFGPFIVVVGGDKDLAAAKPEIRRASDAGYQNAGIVKRDGWFRTVVPFESKAAAERSLADIRKNIRNGSYIRDLRSWCSNLDPSEEGDQKYWDCVR